MNLQWSKEPLSVYEFIEQFEFPQFVKIYKGENQRLQMPGSFDLRQPILMFKVYTCRKIHGRALGVDDSGCLSPTGPGLIIPDNYPGWFSMIMPDGRTASCFESIGDVSRAGLPMFLVQDSVVGLMVESTGLNRKLVPHGEVLKVIQIYEDSNREKICQQLKRDIHPDVMMYLKCLTRQGEVVFLPYSTKGRFYYISTPEYHTLNHVYLISNLLRVSKLPVVVRIVTGPKPQIALPLSNIVQLDEVQNETVILGCTMVDNKPVLLEINANSKFSFVTAKDKSYMQKTNTFKRMNQVCIMEGERWRQQIRVAHHVVPRAQGFASIDGYNTPSSCTSISKSKRIDLKPSLPPSALVQHLRYSYCDRFFSKRFWTFRRSKRMEYPNLHNGSFRLPVEMLKSYYVKRKGSKGSDSKESSQRRKFRKYRMEYPRAFHSSDDGYATSCADVESIYNSIH